MTEILEFTHRQRAAWKIQGSVSKTHPVAASCEGFYFKSPVPYMPGEELTCRVEYLIEGEASVCACIEYLLKVLRIDADGESTVFGIACLIQDQRNCTLQRTAPS